MNIKAKIEELAQRIGTDEALRAQFAADPIAAVEQLLGIDLPNDQIQAIVDGIRAKVRLDQLGSVLGGLGGLFGK